MYTRHNKLRINNYNETLLWNAVIVLLHLYVGYKPAISAYRSSTAGRTRDGSTIAAVPVISDKGVHDDIALHSFRI
jgi:hypothetical protein